MISRPIIAFLFSVLLFINVQSFVKREKSSEISSTHLVEGFNENIDQFRACIDQSLAKTVGEINVKQLQPLFSAISDNLDRISKAFDDLTAPRSTREPPPA